MISPLRKLLNFVQELPLWIKIPLIVMESGILISFLSWLYITRSVGVIEVPDVTDLKIDRVRAFLEQKEINYRVVEKNSLQTPDGVIMRQRPRPGERIKETRRIDIFVSKGAAYVAVPNLTGKSLLSAKNQLYRQSRDREQTVGPLFSLGNIARVYSSKQPTGRIIMQQPSPGQRILRGSQVNVLVSRGKWPKRTVIPDLRGLKLKTAKKKLKKNHLSEGDVHYTLDKEKNPSVILDQSPPSGRLVRRDRPVSLSVNLSRDDRVPPTRHTFIRVSPPLSVDTGQMKIEMTDLRGTRIVYNEKVAAGHPVEFLASVKGDANLTIYWNDEIYKFRELEWTR